MPQSTQLPSRYRFGATRLWRGSSALGPGGLFGPAMVRRIFPTLGTLGNPFWMRTSQKMLKEGVGLYLPFPRREPGIGPGWVEKGLLGQLRVLERQLHVLGRVVLKPGAIVDVGSHLPQYRGESGIRLALPDPREELAQGENEPEGLGRNGFACHVRRRNSFRNHEQVPSEGGCN